MSRVDEAPNPAGEPVTKRAATRSATAEIERHEARLPPRSAVPSPRIVRVTIPAPRGAWRALFDADADAVVSQSPQWVDAMCANGYEDASRLYETRSGKRLLLPLVRRRGPWSAALAPQASMPNAWGMGGLLAESPATEDELRAVVGDLVSAPSLRTIIRPNPLHAELWQGADGGIALPRLAHVLDLEGGAESVWKRFRTSARNGVRKAEKAGLEIECGNSPRLLSAFHALLKLSIERWAAQQHEPARLALWRGERRDPLQKFERIAASLGDAMRVWVAWKDGAPAAAIIVLLGANAHYTRGAMDKKLAGPTRANDLLQWLAIEDACNSGCGRYHMGESGSSRALADFKTRFAAEPVPYAEYRFERLPLTRADSLARGLVKRALRFRDA